MEVCVDVCECVCVNVMFVFIFFLCLFVAAVHVTNIDISETAIEWMKELQSKQVLFAVGLRLVSLLLLAS